MFKNLNQSISLPAKVSNITGWIAKSVEPDGASGQGLHCLLRPVCPNTEGKHDNIPI